MKYSQACIDLVKRFEGLRLAAYRCPAGVWTIGYGHTRGVKEGMTTTPEQADAWAIEDLDEVLLTLRSIIPPHVGLSQGQLDALCSLGFNLVGGPASIPRKAPKLWSALVHANGEAAAHEFLDMDHALVNGVVVELPGLKSRREAEAQLFLA